VLETHGAAFSALVLRTMASWLMSKISSVPRLTWAKACDRSPEYRTSLSSSAGGSLDAGQDLLVGAPAGAHLVDGFLLAGLGDVFGLCRQLVLELGHVLLNAAASLWLA